MRHGILLKASITGRRAPVGAARSSHMVPSPKLSHLVAERLRAQIARGELEVGGSLPSEAELLSYLGISRPTLREALRILESESLIRLGRGARSGATILGPSVEAAGRYSAMYLASHGTTLAEIHETRMLLEPSLAARLAKSAKKEHIMALRKCVTAQSDAIEMKDYVAAITSIMDFHAVMVRCSENRALGLLSGVLQEISLKVYPQMLITGRVSVRQAVQRRTERSAKSHRELLEMIIRHKANEAELYWRAYMEDTDTFLADTGLGKLHVQLPGST